MTASQPAPVYLTPCDQTVGAGLLAKAAWQLTQLDCVYIHCCGNGRLGFRPDGGSLWKSPKVTKGLLPHHSAPRSRSVCPNAGLNPWAAATRHPWRGAANPASCRVTHEFKPAFGQRGLTGRLRSKADQDQERLASHRGYRRRGAPRCQLKLSNRNACLPQSPNHCQYCRRYCLPHAAHSAALPRCCGAVPGCRWSRR